MSSVLILEEGTMEMFGCDTAPLILLLLLLLIGGRERGLASSTRAARKGFPLNLLRHLVVGGVVLVFR